MILEWINKRLSQRLNRKKQDVVKLRWQKAKLQRQLNQIKRESEKS